MLYHVTFYDRLPQIARRGLVPGRGHGGWGGAYGNYSQGFVFLTMAEGVSFWYGRYELIAESQTDNVLTSGLIPVVLRVLPPYPADLELDPEGSRDAPDLESAWRTSAVIPPQQIEVWDGVEWLPLADSNDVDPAQALEVEEVESDWGEPEELYYFRRDNPLLPEDVE